MEERFVVILAGGSGTRFWPLSRDGRPKQLIDLFGAGTLLAQTVRRVEGLVPPGRILILTNAQQREAVLGAVPQVPEENVLAEPAKRDTAPAVALGIGWVARRNPRAVMAVLPADHLIQGEEEFRRVLAGAMDVAQRSNGIVTLGVKPSWPCPDYGYIQLGDEVAELTTPGGIAPREVVRFREKPKPEVAEEFLRQGGFSWNAGMFIWPVEFVRKELRQHASELADFVDGLESAEDFAGLVTRRYSELPKISIDYALMEKVKRSYNVEATFDWDDVGSWHSLARYLPEDAEGNRCRAHLTGVEACNNLVFSETSQHVALLGVSGLVVVQTGDALLIASRSAADQMKALVERIPEELR